MTPRGGVFQLSHDWKWVCVCVCVCGRRRGRGNDDNASRVGGCWSSSYLQLALPAVDVIGGLVQLLQFSLFTENMMAFIETVCVCVCVCVDRKC